MKRCQEGNDGSGKKCEVDYIPKEEAEAQAEAVAAAATAIADATSAISELLDSAPKGKRQAESEGCTEVVGCKFF